MLLPNNDESPTMNEQQSLARISLKPRLENNEPESAGFVTSESRNLKTTNLVNKQSTNSFQSTEMLDVSPGLSRNIFGASSPKKDQSIN